MENFVAIRLKVCNAMHKKYTWLHGGNLMKEKKSTSITSFLNPDEDFDRKKNKTFS